MRRIYLLITTAYALKLAPAAIACGAVLAGHGAELTSAGVPLGIPSAASLLMMVGGMALWRIQRHHPGSAACSVVLLVAAGRSAYPALDHVGMAPWACGPTIAGIESAVLCCGLSAAALLVPGLRPIRLADITAAWCLLAVTAICAVGMVVGIISSMITWSSALVAVVLMVWRLYATPTYRVTAVRALDRAILPLAAVTLIMVVYGMIVPAGRLGVAVSLYGCAVSVAALLVEHYNRWPAAIASAAIAAALAIGGMAAEVL